MRLTYIGDRLQSFIAPIHHFSLDNARINPCGVSYVPEMSNYITIGSCQEADNNRIRSPDWLEWCRIILYTNNEVRKGKRDALGIGLSSLSSFNSACFMKEHSIFMRRYWMRGGLL